jgi:hypothetical protein
VFAATPNYAWFIVPGIVVGAALSFLVETCFTVFVLFRQGEEMRRKLLCRMGEFNFGKMIILFEVIGTLSEIFLTLGGNSYLLATPNAIVVSRPWSLGETNYDYADVTAVEVRDVLVDNQWVPIFTIVFADGSRWPSQGWIKNSGPIRIAEDRNLAMYVVEKAKVTLTKVH